MSQRIDEDATLSSDFKLDEVRALCSNFKFEQGDECQEITFIPLLDSKTYVGK